MEIREVIAEFRQIWDACTPVAWHGPAELELQAKERIPFARLRSLAPADIFASFADQGYQAAYDSGSPSHADPGSVITLRLPRQINRLVVVPSVDELLRLPEAQVTEPAALVIVSVDAEQSWFGHVRGDNLSEAPPSIRRYQQAVQLWSVLAKQAHHLDETTGGLLFFGIRRTTILPGFTLQDLSDEIAVDAITGFTNDEDRKATREEIFASVLSEFLRDQDPARAFQTILRGSRRFARRLSEGLAIYLAEHSPEKLAEEAKAAALALSEKLEKIISGLETKSLSVPVALLFAFKDVEPGAGATALNLVLLASALTYAATMTFVHISQSSLLQTLKTTLSSSEAEFRRKGLDAENPVLASSYWNLRRRARAARWGSLVMCSCSWVPLLCVVGAVWLGTPERVAPTEPQETTSTRSTNQPNTGAPPQSFDVGLPEIRFHIQKPDQNGGDDASSSQSQRPGTGLDTMPK